MEETILEDQVSKSDVNIGRIKKRSIKLQDDDHSNVPLSL